jgi:hypothetical protein
MHPYFFANKLISEFIAEDISGKLTYKITTINCFLNMQSIFLCKSQIKQKEIKRGKFIPHLSSLIKH